jgi:hypothetical protein
MKFMGIIIGIMNICGIVMLFAAAAGAVTADIRGTALAGGGSCMGTEGDIGTAYAETGKDGAPASSAASPGKTAL